MAELKITIPDNQVQRILNGVCSIKGYSETVEIVDAKNQIQIVTNPQSKADFVKSIIIKHIKSLVKNAETIVTNKDSEIESIAIS